MTRIGISCRVFTAEVRACLVMLESMRVIADHQAPSTTAEVAAWQVEMCVSNAEVADLVGVEPSTWSSHKAGGNVPATVARLCRAMRADPVILSALGQDSTR